TSARSLDSAALDDRPVAVVPAQVFQLAGRRRLFYRVVAGDTLADIAARLGVSEGELCRWSALDPASRLYEGMLLQTFAPETSDWARAGCLRENQVRIVPVASGEFFEYFEGLRGRRRAAIIVEQKDSWEKIARRMQLTVGQLERINQRSHTEKLVPKQTLIV